MVGKCLDYFSRLVQLGFLVILNYSMSFVFCFELGGSGDIFCHFFGKKFLVGAKFGEFGPIIWFVFGTVLHFWINSSVSVKTFPKLTTTYYGIN